MKTASFGYLDRRLLGRCRHMGRYEPRDRDLNPPKEERIFYPTKMRDLGYEEQQGMRIYGDS